MFRMSFNACAIAAALLLTLPLGAQVADGDRHFAARAEGAQGARAKTGPIDAAIAAYQRAVAADANDLEAHWKLLRAYRYKGAYVAANAEQKKQIYGAAKSAGERPSRPPTKSSARTRRRRRSRSPTQRAKCRARRKCSSGTR